MTIDGAGFAVDGSVFSTNFVSIGVFPAAPCRVLQASWDRIVCQTEPAGHMHAGAIPGVVLPVEVSVNGIYAQCAAPPPREGPGFLGLPETRCHQSCDDREFPGGPPAWEFPGGPPEKPFPEAPPGSYGEYGGFDGGYGGFNGGGASDASILSESGLAAANFDGVWGRTLAMDGGNASSGGYGGDRGNWTDPSSNWTDPSGNWTGPSGNWTDPSGKWTGPLPGGPFPGGPLPGGPCCRVTVPLPEHHEAMPFVGNAQEMDVADGCAFLYTEHATPTIRSLNSTAVQAGGVLVIAGERLDHPFTQARASSLRAAPCSLLRHNSATLGMRMSCKQEQPTDSKSCLHALQTLCELHRAVCGRHVHADAVPVISSGLY